jgi:ABC-type transporter Mla subunit MlaD
MSSKKHDIDESCVINKLDKVADTLESASNQLSGVVTQQQLDLVAQRIASCETTLASLNVGVEVLAKRTAAHADESANASTSLDDKIKTLESEFSGMRALTMSAFALATIGLIALIVTSVF